MFKFVSSVCAAVMVVTVPFAAPAVAMPVAKPAPAWSDASPLLVQHDRYSQDRNLRRGWPPRRDNWADNDRRWRGDGPQVRHWRGHRGYRDYRPGYRRHDGFWFPPAAFIAGAIIGGAIAGQEPPVRYRPRGGAHEEWCYNRYRSYRASDNTFQPYNGGRRQCNSPYG
ncbi:BA14K family protein [Mesorhizobium sp. CAU 1741]|uniref:BA14K family protein n=1 Tax=Mesorhizobium sp. CAU 1741 TaxID=3140366 RepID=UPI00325AD878